MTSALVILAAGAEEMETTIAVDVLRRAKIEVTLAGLDGSDPVECSRGVKLVPDVALADVQDQAFDALVLPGGNEGARRLRESAVVGALLRRFEQSGKLVAAVCAGPTALAAHGVFAGRRLTSHPAAAAALVGHGERVESRVVIDGALITSQGPGTTFDFALAIVAALRGEAAQDEVRGPMMLDLPAAPPKR